MDLAGKMNRLRLFKGTSLYVIIIEAHGPDFRGTMKTFKIRFSKHNEDFDTTRKGPIIIWQAASHPTAMYFTVMGCGSHHSNMF